MILCTCIETLFFYIRAFQFFPHVVMHLYIAPSVFFFKLYDFTPIRASSFLFYNVALPSWLLYENFCWVMLRTSFNSLRDFYIKISHNFTIFIHHSPQSQLPFYLYFISSLNFFYRLNCKDCWRQAFCIKIRYIEDTLRLLSNWMSVYFK